MKIQKTILAAVAMLFTFGACAQGPASQPAAGSGKSIVVYFTHSNNTGLAARQLAEQIGARMVRILPEEPYSTEDLNWTNQQSRCTQEHLDQTLRPAIKALDVDFSQVDTVFIGFPIWWHEEPAVIRTFLDNTDLTGKEVYPFCTSYESPMSEADATLRKGYPALRWHTGLRFPATPEEVRDWLAR